jgi:hypothetical protein
MSHVLAAVPPVQIPEWARTGLLVLGIAMAALFVLWLLTSVIRWMHRRAYNLTKMETAPARGPDPAFLKVDHEAREEAIRRGDAYVRPGEGEKSGAAPGEPGTGSLWSRWGLFSRIGAVIIALAHVGVAVVSVAAMVKDADEVVQQVTAADCIRAILARYWLGFLLGMIVIVAEAVRLFLPARRKA